MSDDDTNDQNGIYEIFAPLMINLRINPQFHRMLPFDRRMKLIEKLEHFLFLHPEPLDAKTKSKLISKIRGFIANIQTMYIQSRNSADLVFDEFINDLNRYNIIPKI